jgi:hypothetical protein
MNDGHVLVIILASFIVVQTIAVGVYKYFRALADVKTMEAAAIDAASKRATDALRATDAPP